MSWLHGLTARARLLFAPRGAESRVNEEMRFHIEMEAERIVREEGVDAIEARRRALVSFGGVESHKETLRDGRGAAWVGGLSLDVKLGVRMLAKFPGLTIVSVVGLAVAVAIGAVSFSTVSTIVDGSLPLDEGDRVVTIQNWDVRNNRDDGMQTHLHDFPVWRDELTTVTNLAAFRTIDRNLITRDGRSESIRIAEMTASAFRLARVAPLLGRYFNDEDERRGAQPVAVIGYDLWQNRFGGRRDIIGQSVDLGATRHMIIGVMPPGFAFPINNRVWTPLQLVPSSFPPGKAPRIDVIGRLAPDASLEDAQREVAAIGHRLLSADSASHAYVQPHVLRYTRSFIDSPQLAWMLHLVVVAISMLLVVIGTNVAVLIYARTANRMGEISVRMALGASRSRVVAQLFAEALVLSTLAAGAGIGGARLALRQIDVFVTRVGGEQLPYWMHFGITPGVIVYAAGLAIVAAVIVGVAPGLKATRADVLVGLQQIGLGNSGMRLGKSWTFMIVAQVAVAVVLLPLAFHGLDGARRAASTLPAFAAPQFLMATLVLDEPDRVSARPAAAHSVVGKAATIGRRSENADDHAPAFAARFANLRATLRDALMAEPNIVAVTFSSSAPGAEPSVRVEVDSAPAGAPLNVLVGASRVSLDFFEAFDVPLLTGRRFQSGDVSSTARPIIVNRSFVWQVFGGENPLGRRVRTATRHRGGNDDSSPGAAWDEIVGVVADFPTPADSIRPKPKIYGPLLPTESTPVEIAVRARAGKPAELSSRVRERTVALDPMLRLANVQTLDRLLHDQASADRIASFALALIALSTLLLSAAGMHALMSFTVAQRRREIGIRSALGAGRSRLLLSVLLRASRQIAIGIVAGVAILIGATLAANDGTIRTGQWRSLVLLAVLMAVVGLVAAMGPARRALRIQPTEALKS